MKKIQKVIGFVAMASALAWTSCGPQQAPVRLPQLPLAEVQPYFSEAAEVQAIDTAYYQVLDEKGNVMGTVLLSAPYSASVNGYNGPTPLLIALDAENHIKNVVLLANQETPRFAQRVEESGLYASWNGLTVDEALDKQVDAVSGATFSSKAVIENLRIGLKEAARKAK